MLTIVNLIFLTITGVLLAADSYFYPGVSVARAGIDSRIALMAFVLINSSAAFFGRIYIPERILRINKRFFFPLLLISAVLIIANYFIHKTFVLSTLGIFPDMFFTLSVLSGFLVYMDPRRSWLKSVTNRLIFFAPAFVFAVVVIFQHFNPEGFWILTQEDHIFEWSQFLFYFFAGLAAFAAFVKLGKNRQDAIVTLGFLAFSLLMFFIAFEEISWGQRILGIETPESIERLNWQNETSLHNLGFIQSRIYYFYMAISAYGAFSYVFVRKYLPKLFSRLNIIFPHPLYSFYFFVGLSSYFYERFVYFYYQIGSFERIAHDNPGKWMEVAELYLAVGFFFFAFFAWKKYRLRR